MLPPDEQGLDHMMADAAFMAAVLVAEGETPKTATEALSGPDAARWREAIEREMQAMVEFGVWDPDLVELPPGKTAVDSKLVFRHSDVVILDMLERYDLQ